MESSKERERKRSEKGNDVSLFCGDTLGFLSTFLDRRLRVYDTIQSQSPSLIPIPASAVLLLVLAFYGVLLMVIRVILIKFEWSFLVSNLT